MTQAGQKLAIGPSEYITGGNGAFLMQSDGALVVCAALEPASAAGTRCAAGAVPLWSSGTAGHAGAYAVMQQDGMLSVFPRDACPPNNDCRLWQSHTMAKAGCSPGSTNCSFVVMQTDGNTVMYVRCTKLLLQPEKIVPHKQVLYDVLLLVESVDTRPPPPPPLAIGRHAAGSGWGALDNRDKDSPKGHGSGTLTGVPCGGRSLRGRGLLGVHISHGHQLKLHGGFFFLQDLVRSDCRVVLTCVLAGVSCLCSRPRHQERFMDDCGRHAAGYEG